MLNKIKIINFRSIATMDLYFDTSNNIIGNNGAGKTNVLQAILCLFQNSSLTMDEIVKNGEQHVFLEGVYISKDGLQNTISYSYDKEIDKKQILLNGKKVTKKVLLENILKASYFSPISMNLFYLGPKYRRDFLDDILKNTYSDYDSLLKQYEKIVKNRNKVLKNIAEEKSQIHEISFWNEEFIKLAKKIYSYRIHLNAYLSENMRNTLNIFQNETHSISYEYISKVDLDQIEESIRSYLEKNLSRDIILGKTHIGPHIDDFDIKVNGKSIVTYASRGEIKSILIELKLQEIHYIQKITGTLPIVLIDDLSSELDSDHSKLILEKLGHLQIIFTSIFALKREKINIISI